MLFFLSVTKYKHRKAKHVHDKDNVKYAFASAIIFDISPFHLTMKELNKENEIWYTSSTCMWLYTSWVLWSLKNAHMGFWAVVRLFCGYSLSNIKYFWDLYCTEQEVWLHNISILISLISLNSWADVNDHKKMYESICDIPRDMTFQK